MALDLHVTSDSSIPIVCSRSAIFKELGFQLEEIGRILDNEPSVPELRAMLLVRRHDAERALAAEALGFTLTSAARPNLKESGGLKVRELEGVERMAVCVRVGLPEEAHLSTSKIGRFIASSGDQLAGPSREYFLQLPSPERMSQAVVEMQFPIHGKPTGGEASPGPS